MKEGYEEFVCDDCGCEYDVEDRNNFKCPNCEDKKATCLYCGNEFIQERDIQICDEHINKYDLDRLWSEHDKGNLDALDFNENLSLRLSFLKRCKE